MADKTFPGMRVDADSLDRLPVPGEYYFDGATWFGMTPNGHLAHLGKHHITEHDDGTITVSPSISVSKPRVGQVWHGYLERGVWREC